MTRKPSASPAAAGLLDQPPLQQRAGAVVIERKHVLRAGQKRHFAQPPEVAACTHQHRRFGIADEVVHLRALVGRVERQVHQARPQRGQIQHQRLDRFVHMSGNDGRAAIDAAQLQAGQQVGHHGRRAIRGIWHGGSDGGQVHLWSRTGGFSGTIRDAGKESVTPGGDKGVSAAEDADPCERTRAR